MISAQHSCTQAAGHRIGYLPLCWFKPQVARLNRIRRPRSSKRVTMDPLAMISRGFHGAFLRVACSFLNNLQRFPSQSIAIIRAMDKTLAHDIMSSKVVTILWKDSLESALLTMKAKAIRHLPVVNDQGQVIGIVTEQDFNRLASFDQTPKLMVKDIMTWPVHQVSTHDDLKSVTRKMINEKTSACLVMDQGHLVGIITTEDLLEVLAGILDDQEQRQFESGSSPLERWTYTSPIGRIADFLSNAGI